MNQMLTPSYRPLYQQIKEALLARIVSGDWPPGTFIPSDSALSKEYGVSVGTLRKALDALANELVVIRHQGKGTFVATHDSDRSLFQFFHLVGVDGKHSLPASRVLVRERRKPRAEEVEVLALKLTEQVIHIQRVRELDDKPALLESVLVSAERFRGLESEPQLLPNTLYDLYQKRFGSSVAHAEERLFAVEATEADAKHLGVKRGSPILEIHRVATDLQGTPLEYRISHCETRNHYYLNKL